MGTLETSGVPTVYNRFDRSKGYKGILFRADEPSQSAEVNEIQSIFVDEQRVLIQSLFGEGRIMKGGECTFSPGTQEVSHITCLPSGSIPAGSYFTFSTTEHDYVIWFRLDGVGNQPTLETLVGRTFIRVDILSTDNSSSVALKLYTALNANITEAQFQNFYQKVIITNDTIGQVSNIADGGPPTGFILNTVIEGTPISAIFGNTTFYALDFSNDVVARQINLTTGETCDIGISILKEIVTEIEDVDLLNPAEGTVNEGLPGAYRLKLSGRWCKESEVVANEVFFQIYNVVDGILIQPKVRSPQIETTLNLLGDYDVDGNGSYVVEGFEVTFDHNVASVNGGPEDLHQMNIGHGIGHVDGRKVVYDYSRKFTIPFAYGVSSLNNESITFLTDGWYNLARFPINSITEINGTATVPSEAVTRSSVSNYDQLVNIPVTAIVSVNASPLTVVEGVDYRLNSHRVEWLSANRPSNGSTYYVTYEYSRTVLNPDTSTIDKLTGRVYLSGFKSNSRVDIDYSYYLSRLDRIILGMDGQVTTITGTSDYDNPNPPLIPDKGLSLGTILVKHGIDPDPKMAYNRAFKMSDVQLMFDRLDYIQHNIARLAQLQTIAATDPTTNKINSFTDPFDDDNFRDLGIPQDSLITLGVCMPGYDLDNTSLTIGNSNLLTLSYNEEIEIDQFRYSRVRQINEYMWREPPPLKVTCTPSVYSWVAATNVISIVKQVQVGSITNGHSWHPGGNVIFTHILSKQVEHSASTSQLEGSYTVPRINLTVKAERLNGNEKCEIQFDGKLISGDYFADSEGYLTHQFQLPVGTKSGKRQIHVEGQENHQKGETVFTAIPLFETIVDVDITFVSKTREDPIAEIFTVDQTCFLTSVSLQFEALPEEYVEVYITKTVVGFPDRNGVIGASRLYKNQIQLSKAAVTLPGRTFIWNKFTFDSPVYVEEGVEYAIVVACTDPDCKVRTIKIGDYELSQNKWQTKQGYAGGAFLTSSTASAWLPDHEYDLTFQARHALFNKDTLVDGWYQKIVDFGTINVTDCTDIFLTTTYKTFPDTEVHYYVNLLDRVGYVDTEIFPSNFFEIKTVNNARYTGRVKVKCILKTKNIRLSPMISNTVTLSHGSVILPSEYISRTFDIAVATTHMKINLDMYEPTENDISVYFKTKFTSFMSIARTIEGTAGVAQVVTATTLDSTKYVGGEFLTISNPTKKYYVWFRKNGEGRDPVSHNDNVLTGYDPIVVDVITSDTAIQIASKVVSKITAIPGFTATNVGGTSAVVTITCTSVGICETIKDGEGWKKMVRTGVIKNVGYEVFDVQFASSTIQTDRLISPLTDMKIKVVLDSPSYDGRPFASNLRAYLFAQ